MRWKKSLRPLSRGTGRWVSCFEALHVVLLDNEDRKLKVFRWFQDESGSVRERRAPVGRTGLDSGMIQESPL